MAEKEVLVKAKKSFASMTNGKVVQVSKGKILSLPKDADWVKAGLVDVLGKDSKTETANITPPETATAKPVGKGKGAVTPPETAIANIKPAVSTETESKE